MQAKLPHQLKMLLKCFHIRLRPIGFCYCKRAILVILSICSLLFILPKIPKSTKFLDKTNNPVSQIDQQSSDEVKAEVLHSWNAYTQYAWGFDELRPLTQTGQDSIGAALTMIDSLDTLWILGLKSEFQVARDWIQQNLYFDKNFQDVNLFELVIRVLGGLLSAFNLSKDEMFLTKARLVGKHILQAFDANSIFPTPSINFGGSGLRPRPSYLILAEIASIQLELNELTRLTDDYNYAHNGGLILKHLVKLHRRNGILPVCLEFPTGLPINSSEITFGGRGDSYYEYLLKVWIQTGKRYSRLKNAYLEAVDGLKNKLVGFSKPNKLLYVGQILLGKLHSSQMDHLVCFLPGTLAYGVLHGMPQSHLSIAKKLLRTCYEMYNQTQMKLSPDIVVFSTSQSAIYDFSTKDQRNLLRPEFMESLFYIYQVTKDPIYKQWGRNIFQAFRKYARLPLSGYAAIADVTQSKPVHLDQMDSFWIAETLKYAYLLFNEHKVAELYNLNSWIFSTEGHLFPSHDPNYSFALIYDNIFFYKKPLPFPVWKAKFDELKKSRK